MKPHLCVFLAISYTFLASLVGVDCQESTVDFLPVFLERPAETYYLVRRKPVQIACEAANALRLTFQCNGQDVLPDAQRNYDKFDPDTGSTVVRSILEVSRTEVEHFQDEAGDGFWCECFAWSTPEDDPSPKFIQTRRANVVMAYLNRKFTRDPSDQQAKVGSRVEFVCIPPEGGPIPTVLWRKDGREIEAGGRLEVTGEGSLVIRHVTRDDQGSYDCLAQNSAAKRVSRSAELTIHEPQMLVDGRVEEEQTSADDPTQGLPEVPVFTEEPDSENFAAENKPVKLFCRVVGADILTFNCNGRRVSRERTNLVESTDPGSRVRIIEGSYDVTPDLVVDGQYDCHCVAWYTRPSFRGWRTSESRRAVTRLATLEENFVVEPMSELVGVGDRLDLYCTPPIGTPEAKILWLKDGNPITASDRNYMVDASGTLTIRRVRGADAGSYVCVANNPAHTRRSSPAVITVSEPTSRPDGPVERRTTPSTTTITTTPVPTDEPVFLEEPESTYYIFDGPATASGIVRGADMTEVRCLGNRIPRNELQTEAEVDPETNKRVIRFSFKVTRDVVARERRPYVCTLHAWYVKPGESNWSVKDGAAITFQIGRVGTEFQQTPKEQMVSAGETATFSCVPPDAIPPFMVKWMFDSQLLQDSDRVTITEDSLTIRDVMESDAGLYECRAEHESSGTVQSQSAMLAVTPGDASVTGDSMTTMKMKDEMTDDGMMMTTTAAMEEETTPPPPGTPHFTLQPKERYFLIRDSPAVVTVAVRDSQIISFECNGMRVARGESSTRQVMDSETGVQVSEKMLTVTESEFESFQGDEFLCLSRAYFTDPVTGNLENVTSSVFRVAKAYLRRNFMTAPMSSAAPLDSRVVLECSPPKGVPQPSVTWYKDNVVLEESEHVMTSEEGNLVISAMRPEDAGSYVCVAENIFARRNSPPAQLSFIDAVDVTPTPEPTTPDDMETSGTEMYDSPPVFVSPATDTVYAAQDAPAVLKCEATNTMKITFTCNAQQQMEESRVLTMEGTHEGRKTLEATLEVKRQEVLDAEDPDAFWCQCYAHYHVPGVSDPQYELGERVYVRLAYLDEFQDMENKEMVGTKGNPTSIPCVAPDGMPAPTISWMKNGQALDIEANANLKWPIRGQLLIISLGPEDVGIYRCVASNSAGQRHGGEVAISIDGMTVETPEPEPTSEPTATAEPTSEPEAHTTDDKMMTANPKGCPTRILDCGVGKTPEQLCASLEQYKACVDEVLEDCKDEFRDDSSEFVFMARDRLVQKCQEAGATEEGEGGHNEVSTGDISSCPELLACRVKYEQTDMNFACSGMESFLRCMDNAIEECGLTLEEDPDKSLSDLADWFEMYCQKLVVGEGSMRNCEKYQSCQIPVNSSLPTQTLVTVAYWCPHVHATMDCTKMAAAECEDSNAIERQNVFYELDQNAMGMCPQPTVEGPPPASDPNVQPNTDNAAGGLTASVTLVQLVMISLAFVLR